MRCAKHVAGCDAAGKGRRGLRASGGRGWEVLDEISDAVGASWIDIDDDVSFSVVE